MRARAPARSPGRMPCMPPNAYTGSGQSLSRAAKRAQPSCRRPGDWQWLHRPEHHEIRSRCRAAAQALPHRDTTHRPDRSPARRRSSEPQLRRSEDGSRRRRSAARVRLAVHQDRAPWRRAAFTASARPSESRSRHVFFADLQELEPLRQRALQTLCRTPPRRDSRHG